MANRKSGSKISCEIRCMDRATVDAARRRLDSAGVERVAYTCKLSGAEESALLIGDGFAAEIMKSLPVVVNVAGMKILAGLYAGELCECDVATLTGVPEHEVVSRLQKFEGLGLVAHRRIEGMNYYRLISDIVRSSIEDALHEG